MPFQEDAERRGPGTVQAHMPIVMVREEETNWPIVRTKPLLPPPPSTGKIRKKRNLRTRGTAQPPSAG